MNKMTKLNPAEITVRWRKKNKMLNKYTGNRKNMSPQEKSWIKKI